MQFAKNDFNGIELNVNDRHTNIKLPNFIEVPQSGTEFDNEQNNAEFEHVFQSHPVRCGSEFLTEMRIGPMLGMFRLFDL